MITISCHIRTILFKNVANIFALDISQNIQHIFEINIIKLHKVFFFKYISNELFFVVTTPSLSLKLTISVFLHIILFKMHGSYNFTTNYLNRKMSFKFHVCD